MKPTYTYRALVQQVVDGDTVVVDIDLGLRQWSHGQRLRLCLADGRGIDAPEKTGATAERGLASREHLLCLLQKYAENIDGLGTFEVVVATKKDKQEKYGRWLATLCGMCNGISTDLCQRMIDEGFAVVRDY